MILILAVTIVAVTISTLLRTAPVFRCITPASDSGYHLLLRREIRRNGFRMPAKVSFLVLDENQNYPWFYHWLLSFFPERWVLRFPSLTGVLSDGALVLAASLFTWHLATRSSFALHPALAVLLAGLLVASCPAFVAVGIGPRAFDITARAFGECLFSYAVLLIGFACVEANYYAGFAGLLLCGLVLLTSKFAAQVLLFISPVIAVSTGNWLVMFLPLAAVAVALILSRGRYWQVLTGQLAHLSLYRRRLQYEHDALVQRNRWRGLPGRVYRALRSCKGIRSRIHAALDIVGNNSIVQLPLRHLLWILATAGAAASTAVGHLSFSDPWIAWLLAWALAPLLPYLVTSTRRFLFLGEAERYLEYSVLPSAVLTVLWLALLPMPNLALTICIYFVFTAVLLDYSLSRVRAVHRGASRDTGQEELVQFLQTLPKNRVLLAIPLWLCWKTAWRLEHRFLAAMDTNVWNRDYDRLFARYPLPSADFDYWEREYGLEYVVVATGSLEYLRTTHAEEFPYDFARFSVAFENGRFVVYCRSCSDRFMVSEEHVN